MYTGLVLAYPFKDSGSTKYLSVIFFLAFSVIHISTYISLV